jgi:hypothetical protein
MSDSKPIPVGNVTIRMIDEAGPLELTLPLIPAFNAYDLLLPDPVIATVANPKLDDVRFTTTIHHATRRDARKFWRFEPVVAAPRARPNPVHTRPVRRLQRRAGRLLPLARRR